MGCHGASSSREDGGTTLQHKKEKVCSLCQQGFFSFWLGDFLCIPFGMEDFFNYMFSDTSGSHKQIFNLELLSVVSELQYYYSTDLLLAFLY
jgi:hypothetical protein